MVDMEPALARELWHRLEVVNAVTYFSPECRDAATRLGLRGFWMGYFASRAAPMGSVGAGVVEATFFNFHPERVRRAIPDAWELVDAADIVVARSQAASMALRRILTDEHAEGLAALVVPAARAAIDLAGDEGRPLFGANRDVPLPTDPVAALWQAATTLREHRGDGHVALLTSAGLDGCEVHVLFAAAENVPSELYQSSRGWSADDWASASSRLADRGLLDDRGMPTIAGRQMRAEIEAQTDRLAVVPYASLGTDRIERLMSDMDPMVDQILAANDITFPNPMGLPAHDG